MTQYLQQLPGMEQLGPTVQLSSAHAPGTNIYY